MSMLQRAFDRLALAAARFAGRPGAFFAAVGLVIAWAVTGPMFGFSDTWQLIINTGTTIITFLMVFLIQSTQNRDTEAIQLKLDELIRATEKAHNSLIDLEKMDAVELERVRQQFEALARHARGEAREDGVKAPVRPRGG
ncbi:MAG TPA: low affinity iron permease family protein [Lysobacter sp.]|nr:low affinity iron permease family protein [Lysobacter sp.]